jgi:hypothetical protein
MPDFFCCAWGSPLGDKVVSRGKWLVLDSKIECTLNRDIYGIATKTQRHKVL